MECVLLKVFLPTLRKSERQVSSNARDWLVSFRRTRDTLNAERDGKLVKTGWTNARCKDMT